MTNDVEEAEAFWRRHEGEVIYKQFIALRETWRETRPRVWARTPRRVDRARASDLPKTCACCGGCQSYGNRGSALRCGYRRAGADYPQDVRMNLAAKYVAHELPADTIRKLVRLRSDLA